MLNIPGSLPMPDKQQGLFHTLLYTFFHKSIWMSPEVQTPAPEPPEGSQGNPENQHETFDVTDQLLQGTSSCPGTSALSGRPSRRHDVSSKIPDQHRCFFIVSGKFILPQAIGKCSERDEP